MEELVGESLEYQTWLTKNKKYAYHAFCVHKKTGMVVEQVSSKKENAIHMAQSEMNNRIKNGIGGIDAKP